MICPCVVYAHAVVEGVSVLELNYIVKVAGERAISGPLFDNARARDSSAREWLNGSDRRMSSRA